jgi:pre-mRNA-splicing factor ISY1
MLEQTRSRAGTSRVDDEQPQYISYVPLPEQREIERRVMAKKKSELMAKYASDLLIQQQEEAKQMLNIDQ